MFSGIPVFGKVQTSGRLDFPLGEGRLRLRGIRLPHLGKVLGAAGCLMPPFDFPVHPDSQPVQRVDESSRVRRVPWRPIGSRPTGSGPCWKRRSIRRASMSALRPFCPAPQSNKSGTLPHALRRTNASNRRRVRVWICPYLRRTALRGSTWFKTDFVRTLAYQLSTGRTNARRFRCSQQTSDSLGYLFGQVLIRLDLISVVPAERKSVTTAA